MVPPLLVISLVRRMRASIEILARERIGRPIRSGANAAIGESETHRKTTYAFSSGYAARRAVSLRLTGGPPQLKNSRRLRRRRRGPGIDSRIGRLRHRSSACALVRPWRNHFL